MFGDKVTNDLAGLIDKGLVKKGYALPVLCEGCGDIMVDHLGKKVGTIDEIVNEACLPRKDE